MGPLEIPGGDWIALCLDPQGAAFGLHARRPGPGGPDKATAPRLAQIQNGKCKPGFTRARHSVAANAKTLDTSSRWPA